MIASHRGYRLDAHRAKSLGGDTLLYWSIFRERDMREMDSGFSTTSDTSRTWLKLMKQRVDAEIADGAWS